MILKTINYPALGLALLALLACANGEADQADTAADSAAAAPVGQGEALLPNTPPGGLEDWVREITEGARDLPQQAITDAVMAQRVALDLYVGRQEFIEQYWGPTRPLHPAGGTALGEAVLSAEAQFHEVLQLLAGAQPLDTARVRVSVDSLAARLAHVVAIAKRAGATMIPPGNRPAGGAQE